MDTPNNNSDYKVILKREKAVIYYSLSFAATLIIVGSFLIKKHEWALSLFILAFLVLIFVVSFTFVYLERKVSKSSASQFLRIRPGNFWDLWQPRSSLDDDFINTVLKKKQEDTKDENI